MKPAPRLTGAVLVLLLPGCTQSPTPAVPSSRPPVVHVRVAELRQQPAHTDHDGPVSASSVSEGPADPAGVAAELVVESLSAQGLTVTDIGAQPTVTPGPGTAVVVVAATYTGPDGRPHTAVYEVQLHHRAGSWRLDPGASSR